MKKIFYILFILYTTLVSGATYYVAPSTATPAGSDANAGTIASPWLTWTKSSTIAIAGDTVYFRGGVYYQSNLTTGTGELFTHNSGTYANPICFFNYPGERPILDCSNITSRHVNNVNNWNWGIRIDGDYKHFKGLEIKNCIQFDENTLSQGISANDPNGLILEQMVVHEIWGPGIYYTTYASDTVNVINCDSHHNCDSLSYSLGYLYYGGLGTGIMGALAENAVVYIKGCRVWKVSDTGFSSGNVSQNDYAEWDSCWAWDIGYMMGDACAWKFGQSGAPSTSLLRVIRNCIAAYCYTTVDLYGGIGFTENNQFNYMYDINMHIYNNFSYHNNYGFRNWTLNISPTPDGQNWYRNNISYGNTTNNVIFEGDYYHENNSWDASPSVTITDDDFISLDTTGMTGARQADGSLPEINFGKLAQGSDLINAGIDVGLPYNGGAPDMGWFESAYEAPEPPLGSRNVIIRRPADKQVIIRSTGTKQIIIR